MSLFSQVSNQIKGIYKPQIANYQKQIAAIPSQFDPQRTALEQARRNAFRRSGEEAQARGLFYSGLVPQKQAEYIGNTYTPALAQIGANQLAAKNTLVNALNDLLVNRGQDIYNRYDTLNQNNINNQLSKEGLAVQRKIMLLQ